MIETQQSILVNVDHIVVDTKHRVLDVKTTNVKKLIESMELVGRILNPLLVTIRGKDTYQLVAGATRLEAAKQLGWGEVPVVVVSGTDDEVKRIEVEENLARNDLTEAERERLEHVRKVCSVNIDKAVEEAKAYAQAHPEERARQEKEGDASTAALKRRMKGKTSDKPKRSHRATGRKSVAAIARGHGANPKTVQKRLLRERANGDKNKVSPKAQTARDTALDGFSDRILDLIRRVGDHKPKRFVGISASVEDLNKLAGFLLAIAVLKWAEESAEQMKAKMAQLEGAETKH